MQYFRVKKEYDQKSCGSLDFLIANELFTAKELKKAGISKVHNYFECINLSKNKTYFSFGARFETKLK